MRWLGVLAAMGLAGAAVPAIAHHSQGAVYDQFHTIAIVGTISRIEVQNPHSVIEIAIPLGDGNAITWVAEGRGVDSMNRAGFNSTSVRVGDKVTVTGSPAWAIEHRMWLGALQTSRGKLYDFNPHAN